MFGHESGPAKIFAYDCEPPAQNAELVREQLYAAHKYRNKLCEIELARRAATDAVLTELHPHLATTEKELAEVEAKIEEYQTRIKQQRAATRTRTTDRVLAGAVREAKARRKELFAKRKQMRADAFADPIVKERLADVEEASRVSQRAARANSDLYWGTYLTVEQACRSFRAGAPPRFMRFTGEGKLAVQLQGGLSSEAALAGDDSRVRIDPVDAQSAWASPIRSVRRAACRTRAWLRIGTESDGRSPVWTTVQFSMHRPLPPDSQIKWVYLLRRKCGTKEIWKLCFVVEAKTGFGVNRKLADSGTVGIDLGYRMVADGLRVAYWCAEDGSEGQLILPREKISGFTKANDLRAIRDKMFDAVKLEVTRLLKSVEQPDWLVERFKTFAQWRSPARLASVLLHWRENRFAGDETVYAHAEAWRKQDKHLYEWEANQRRKLAAWRKNVYGVFAAELSKRFRAASIEKIDWRQIAKHQATEAEEDSRAGQEHRTWACPSELTRCLKESGMEIVLTDAAYTTKSCHACGELTDFDSAAMLHHTCEHCGVLWDQDYNAARNLLAAGLAARGEVATA